MNFIARNARAFLPFLLGGAALAADLGDPAAELKIAKWVKGEPVKVVSGDRNIYVVEFWATWCPPCRTSIPHLTEIQKRFRDKNVVVVGISDEKENVVTPFVNKLGSKMDYRVAIDDKRGTSDGYMKAYSIGGIPHAFVVQDKKVLWQGHPMAGLDKALEEITAGKYDLNKTKAKLKAESLYEQFREAAAEGDDSKADDLARQLEAAVKDGSFPSESFNAAKEKKEIRLFVLQNEYRGALFEENKDQAAEIGKKLKALDPAVDLDVLREDVVVQKLVGNYMRSISGKEESSDQKVTGEQLVSKLKNRPDLANNVAWTILTDQSITDRNIPLATEISKQACEDSKWKASQIIDTYARALFDSGKKADAIKYQEKALAAADDSEKGAFERTLQSYKEGRLPTE